jgi:phage protein D
MAEDLPTGLTSSLPDFYVGGEEQPELGAGLTRLVIVEHTSGLYRCEAKFSNWGNVNNNIDFLYFDRRTLDFGKTFQVKYKDKIIFDGRIMALEAGFPEGDAPHITVLAEDRFQDLRMTRRTRTFADATDADVFNQIASDHGLSPSVSVTGPTYKVLAQVNQSDLAFARERARSVDAELWMEGSTLNVKTHANRGGATLEMKRGAQLREFTVIADLAMQRTSVSVNGWDVPSKSALTYEATESIIASELNGDASGVSILQSALGARKEALAHTVPLNSQEAQYEAETFFRMSARRFIVGYGIAETRPDLRAGAFVDLKELGPLFSGKYYVTEIKHLWDNANGIRTEFRAERPGIGQAR